MSGPDLQGVFTPASYRQGYVGMLDNYPGMTCGFWQHRPASKGHVHITSADPLAAPVVQPNYLSEPGECGDVLARLAERLEGKFTPDTDFDNAVARAVQEAEKALRKQVGEYARS